MTSTGSHAADEPGLRLDDRVLVVDVDARRADGEGVVGREAQDGHVAIAAPAARASSAAGSATTRRPGSGSSAGTVALRVVERRGRDDGLAAVDLDRVGNGVRRSQPSISALPRSGDVQLPVTLPTTSPPDQIGAPSVGAGPPS